MHVRTVHDKWLRLVVSSDAGRALVPVRKAHVTAMCKSVGGSWSAAEASVNLSTNPAVDVVLESSAPHAHTVYVAHVLDEHSVETLQTVTVSHRHIVLQTLADTHAVEGLAAVAKHLVCKNAFIPAIRYATLAMPSYTSLADCEQRFDEILLDNEVARTRTAIATCNVTTVGSPAFRLFKHYNATCTSKITSAFPTQSVLFAQSLCLALGFLASASNEYAPRVVLAHTLQALPLDSAACAHLRGLDDAAADPARTGSRLSVRREDGVTLSTPFLALDGAARSVLAANGIQTRAETPMYVVFDRQHNAVLVADVCMQRVPPAAQLPALGEQQQAVADMHFVNVAAAYHPQLEARRQMLLNKCCAALVRPTPYAKSVFNMLRFEASPMLALLGQLDL